MREALNGRPLGQRTRHEYQRVIDSYRSVYFGSPTSSKADPSVVATAELMVEMGRRFDDNKILRGAIEQYHFLRKEYPGSKYRFDALFTIGEIYKDDLNDPGEARKTFDDFLHRYPHNRLAGDAHAAVKAIDAEAQDKEKQQSAQKTARKQPPPKGNSANPSGGKIGAVDETDSANAGEASAVRHSEFPRVTGVRHWSTPDYTRVAIDVEQEVTFDSRRISHPDRIFFDLRNTQLASTLVGKTFDVDDGFLKKIRVAEYKPGRTRIVLEVDDLASYDAFLLPDPYRLIIDIHGKDNHGKNVHGEPNRPFPAADAGSADADVALTASTESDEDRGDAAPSSGEPKTDGQNVQTRAQSLSQPRLPPRYGTQASDKQRPVKRQSEKQSAGLVEMDLPPQDAGSDEKPPDSTNPANNIGVIKTEVGVKGSNRKIPKTIVEADDRAPTTIAKLKTEKIQPEEPPDTQSKSPSSARRKKAHAASDADDGSALHLDNRRLDSRHLENEPAERGFETREARPTASGDRSLTRALGLKIGKIVIDAGHGGHDTGTIGPNGLLEKDVVLDVAKRLGRLLESRLGAEVVYTRRDDTFIPLETRTAIANRERADLFISIHANSSHDADARGVETYYLNFTSNPEALEVAARENAVSEKSIHELQDLVKKIAMKEKIDESREFAGDVQDSLYGGLSLNNAGIRNRGIKKAPFIVLIGANMPSILAEISFVSNPTDERKLETSEHRQRIAESLYRGVSRYVNGLSGVKVASKIDKGEGQ